jgi:hypothetical protein
MQDILGSKIPVEGDSLRSNTLSDGVEESRFSGRGVILVVVFRWLETSTPISVVGLTTGPGVGDSTSMPLQSTISVLIGLWVPLLVTVDERLSVPSPASLPTFWWLATLRRFDASGPSEAAFSVALRELKMSPCVALW